jgi:hypothetical protein
MDVLLRIKALALWGRLAFTQKAQDEMYSEGLREPDVVESIVNAPSIFKIVRSRSRWKRLKTERLYVIRGLSLAGDLIYTKGTIRKTEGREVFYVLISAKRAL